MSLISNDGKPFSCAVVDFVVDNRKLLEGCDNYLDLVIDGLFQILGCLAVAYGFHNPWGVIEACNCILQLAV